MSARGRPSKGPEADLSHLVWWPQVSRDLQLPPHCGPYPHGHTCLSLFYLHLAFLSPSLQGHKEVHSGVSKTITSSQDPELHLLCKSLLCL